MAYYFSYDIVGLYPELQKIPGHDQLYESSHLHATMLYVHDNPPQRVQDIAFPDITTTIKAIETWHTDTGSFYVVALLDDPDHKLAHIHSELKRITHAMSERNFNPHVSLQKSQSKEDLMAVEKLNSLVGVQVTLSQFKFMPSQRISPPKPSRAFP